MYRLRFDVETRNVATVWQTIVTVRKLRFDVETRNVATSNSPKGRQESCGLM